MCEPECSVEGDTGKPQARGGTATGARLSRVGPSVYEEGAIFSSRGVSLFRLWGRRRVACGYRCRGVRRRVSEASRLFSDVVKSSAEGARGEDSSESRVGGWLRRGSAESPVAVRGRRSSWDQPASCISLWSCLLLRRRTERSEVSSDSWDGKGKGIEVSWKGKEGAMDQEGGRGTGQVGGSRLRSGGGPQGTGGGLAPPVGASRVLRCVLDAGLSEAAQCLAGTGMKCGAAALGRGWGRRPRTVSM